MAAVVPPFSGGKVYATKNGKFTFVNVLFDTDGQLLCTLGGDTLTAYRTPATCALAIRALALDGGSSVTTAALVGAGRQSLKHLEMLAAELPALEEIRVADINPDARAAVVASANAAGIPATSAKDAASAASGAQVIVTITQSRSPLFPADAVADGTLICAIGSTKYDRCEIGADVVARCSAVVCDDVAGSRIECGDLIQAHRAGAFDWEHAVELHAVLAGTVVVDQFPARSRSVRDSRCRTARRCRGRPCVAAVQLAGIRFLVIETSGRQHRDSDQSTQHGRGRTCRRRSTRHREGARRRLRRVRVRRRWMAARHQTTRQRQAHQRRDRDEQGLHRGVPQAPDAHLQQCAARAKRRSES